MGDEALGNLKALAAFAARLREPGATFGAMSATQGSGTPGDPFQMPYWQTSPLAEEFIKMAYDTGWVLADFDWPTWHGTPEAEQLLSNPSVTAVADSDQLMKLLTAIMRSDRFAEGTIAERFRDGTLTAIVNRAEAILKSS